jgi:predicted metalloprotease
MPARGSRGPLRLVPRVALSILFPLVCLGGIACGGNDEEGEHQALTAEPVGGDFQGVSLEAYDTSVEEIVLLLDEYWAETLPQSFDTEYVPPSDVIAYDPERGAPRCGGEPLGPENAFYCPGNRIIAWDEPGLMIPFYSEVGDAAVGFVLAHEWGHLVQHTLEARFPLTIEEELNADCLGGGFARALYDEGLLEGGTGLEPGTDLAEAAEGIFLFGDHPSVNWQDPQAHGTGKQRLRAFEIGFDGGPEVCAGELAPGFTDEL